METKTVNGIEEAFIDADEIETRVMFSITCPRCSEIIEERTVEALFGERQHRCGLHIYVS